MKKCIRISSLVLLALFSCVIFTSSANALANGLYLPQGANIAFRWNVENLRSSTNVYLSESAAENSLTAALNAWSNVRDPNGNSMLTFTLADEGNVDSTFNIGGFDLGNPRSLATVAYAYTIPETSGMITTAIIKLNYNRYWSAGNPNDTQYDVQSLVEHELGHIIGIAHCHDGPTCIHPTCSDNVMNPYCETGEVRTALTDYDTASMKLIYYLNYYGYFS